MDSLVANYASSDEEEQQTRPSPSPSPPKPTSSSSSSLLFSSLPNPKSSSSSSAVSSSSFFSSLPQPKQQLSRPNFATIVEENGEEDGDNGVSDPKPSGQIKSTSSLFSALPPPKTLTPQHHSEEPSIPKRVVQFRPPIIPISSSLNHPTHDSDDEEEEERERNRRRESQLQMQTPSVKSFLSSIPAPKNSSSTAVLGGGALPSASSSGRRSVIETETPPTSSYPEDQIQNQNQAAEDYANYQSGFDQSAEYHVNYGSYESGGAVDQNVVAGDASAYGSYYGDYGNNGDYGQYANNWIDRSGGEAAALEMAGPVVDSALGVPGKRRRNEVPTEIVEVKQDELIKNRPREDQVKMTGIAFGPAYQPASTKGKPTKLHKRKHQIGSLYFDMRQKEMELAERRSRGLLTKAETHAKYGW